MPEDRVTITADGTQYFDVLRRAGTAAESLSGSGTRIGESFLRGDRAIRVATANITQGLLTANSAADATLITMQSLERVFRVPIGLTVFAAAGIALAGVITSAIEKVQKLNEEIRKLVSFSKVSPDFLGTDQINKNLDDIVSKIDELQAKQVTRSHSLLSTFLGTGGFSPTAGIVPALNAQDQEKLNQLIEAAKIDVLDLTEKQNDLNRVEIERLNNQEDIADLDKQELDHKERLGKLASLAAAADLAGTEAARQLLLTENDRYNVAVKILQKKQEEERLAKSIKTASTVENLFKDIGSGKFLADFKQNQIAEQLAQRGREIVAEAQDAVNRGIPIDPVLQAELRAANRAAQGTGTGLQGLLNADFTNLLELSKYDFSGLLPLNGLSVVIQ